MPDASTSVSSPSPASTWRTSASQVERAERSNRGDAHRAATPPSVEFTEMSVAAGSQIRGRRGYGRSRSCCEHAGAWTRRPRRRPRAGGRRPAARGAPAPSGCAGSRGRTWASATSETAASRRRGVRPVEADEALAHVAAERRPDPRGGRRRCAGDLDPVEREEPTSRGQRCTRRPPEPTRTSATATTSSGRTAAVGGGRVLGRGAAMASFASPRARRGPAVTRRAGVPAGGSSSSPRSSTSRSSTTPNCSSARRPGLGHQRDRVARGRARRRSR